MNWISQIHCILIYVPIDETACYKKIPGALHIDASSSIVSCWKFVIANFISLLKTTRCCGAATFCCAYALEPTASTAAAELISLVKFTFIFMSYVGRAY